MNTDDLIKLLPQGYEQACFEKGAITRKRIIKTPLDLLRLILYYLSGSRSLIDVSQFALLSGIGKISDVAFLKKFVKCREWIKWLTENILPNQIIHYKKPAWLESYKVIAVDASDIVEKGAVKKLWHLHYALDLFSLTCSQFKVTGQSTGESLKNFTLRKGCLVITDRAYGTIKSIEHCLSSGSDFIIRIKNKAFNLYDNSEEKIIYTDWLKTVGGTAAELTVYIKTKSKGLVPLRICATRKTEEEIGKEETEKIQQRNKIHTQIYVCNHIPAAGGFRRRSAFVLPSEVAGGTCI